MNFNKELKLNHTKSKLQRFRMDLILGIITFFGLMILGCNKENGDEYYVKYEVNSTTIYYGGKLNATIKTEKNDLTTISIDTRTPWETVIGPVSKGFNASLAVINPGPADSHLKLNAQISVSKNNGPFALKIIDGSDLPRNSVQINYTINF